MIEQVASLIDKNEFCSRNLNNDVFKISIHNSASLISEMKNNNAQCHELAFIQILVFTNPNLLADWQQQTPDLLDFFISEGISPADIALIRPQPSDGDFEFYYNPEKEEANFDEQ